MDPRVFDISRRMTAALLRERLDSANQAMMQRLAEFASRGTAQSTTAFQAMGRICSAEVKAAVAVAWSNLWRAVLNVGVPLSPDLASELKAEVRRETDDQMEALRTKLTQYDQRIRSHVPAVYDEFINARELELTKIDAEIDLAVASFERRAEVEGSHTVFQFYAPVGAVMSGHHASASIVQNIGGEEKAQLARALDGILQAIQRATDVQAKQKDDLVELVRDARGELDRSRPNGIRLSSVLQGIGFSIQTIGSVDAAYQALKTAAGAVGIQLP